MMWVLQKASSKKAPVIICAAVLILVYVIFCQEDPSYVGFEDNMMGEEDTDIRRVAAIRSPPSADIDTYTRKKPGVGANGAWWIDKNNPGQRYYLDFALCHALERLFEGKNVLDLGAGLGLYGRCFLRKREPMFPENPKIDQHFFKSFGNKSSISLWWNTTNQKVKSWTGYDGSPNVEQLTKGFVKHMDLSKAQDFQGRTWDWVMSLEVGEHIPAQFEDNFIANIVKPVEEGLILSWAVRGQGGTGHVNTLNNTEVDQRLAKRGFTLDPEVTISLRSKTNISWLKNTLMAFVKTKP